MILRSGGPMVAIALGVGMVSVPSSVCWGRLGVRAGEVSHRKIVESAATVTSLGALTSSSPHADASRATPVTPSVWPQSRASKAPSSEYSLTDLSLLEMPTMTGLPFNMGAYSIFDIATASPPSESAHLNVKIVWPDLMLDFVIERSVEATNKVL